MPTRWGKIVLLLASCWISPVAMARPAPTSPTQIVAPDHVKVDLIRAGSKGMGRKRIYIQAQLPDGELGLFLVDTGAAISALSKETAERLDLEVQRDWAFVEGLGGRAPLHKATLPFLSIGEARLEQVEFAVDVAGLPTTAGFMPLDGILGNNVWSQFVMEIDYPADRLMLHKPGTIKLPKTAQPMHFAENSVYSAVGIKTSSKPSREGYLVVQLDTGAGELLLSGSDILPFPATPEVFTQGVEPVFGIGAAETLPPNVFLRETRRIPLESVSLGGKKVPVDFSARWLNYTAGLSVGPKGLAGLAGHDLFENYNVLFDFNGGKFALKKSKRPKRALDGHRILLEQDEQRFGKDKSRYLHRAKLNTGLENYKKADQLLVEFLDSKPEAKLTGEARVLLAAVRRFQGDLAGAWEAVQPLSPAELVEQGEIVAVVNGLLLEGHIDEAQILADQAIATFDPRTTTADNPNVLLAHAHVARADVWLSQKQWYNANDELMIATHLLENPDAQLLRRARVALASGDRFGAMAHIRRLLQLFPSNGQYLWFYATLLETDADQVIFKSDMSEAMNRLHPDDKPLDYLVHAEHLLGNQEQALTFLKQGISRDCSKAPGPEDVQNCEAWYLALAGSEPDRALAQITTALAKSGPRSDFLDTKAMVHLSRGEYSQAWESAIEAARMSPDEVYMLWQAERIGQIAVAHGANRPSQSLP